jgi:hypothetical protein
MHNYYILISSDTFNFSGECFSGKLAAESRLSVKRWPLYHGTRNRNSLSEGDICLVYIAGSGEYSQCFFGCVEIESVSSTTNKNKIDFFDSLLIDQNPVGIVKFKSVNIFDSPIPIRPLLDFLSFMPKNKERWGSGVQGGCRKISKEDFEIIKSKIANS